MLVMVNMYNPHKMVIRCARVAALGIVQISVAWKVVVLPYYNHLDIPEINKSNNMV